MPRKQNERAVEFVKMGLKHGKSVPQIMAEAKSQRLNVSRSLVGYYAYGKGKGKATETPAVAMSSPTANYSNKILRARKILEADFLEEELRVDLAKKVLE